MFSSLYSTLKIKIIVLVLLFNIQPNMATQMFYFEITCSKYYNDIPIWYVYTRAHILCATGTSHRLIIYYYDAQIPYNSKYTVKCKFNAFK
jgi:hypothetical protein